MEGIESEKEGADFVVELRIGEEQRLRELRWLCGY